MPKLRVLVMMDEALIPPESVAGTQLSPESPFKTEHDVLTALRFLGHEARPVGVKTDLTVLSDAIRDFRPHVCFNLVEDFDGIPSRDQHVVSYLELINQPYTGSKPRGLTLARDKAVTKMILAHHGVRVPQFAVLPVGCPVVRPDSLGFPLMVKSLSQEGSLGIAQASVVTDDAQFFERVTFLHQRHQTDVIAEQYIDGRELYVGVLGNRKLRTLPVWELCLDQLPPEANRIATAKVKWDPAYRLRHGINSRPAANLSEAMRRHVAALCKRVYRALDLSGYARIDLRLTPAGELYLLEANPNPQIARGEDFADSAAAAGIEYEPLLQRILSLGMSYPALGAAA